MAVVGVPVHRVWFATAFTVAVGFTVIVKLVAIPAQPAATGVTVMVAVTGTAPRFVAMNDAILPLPLAANPIDAVLLVQLYTVPVTAPVKFTAVVADPLHNA